MGADDDGDGDDVVGYIHLLTPRHTRHNSCEINRISTTPHHIQRARDDMPQLYHGSLPWTTTFDATPQIFFKFLEIVFVE